VDEACPKCNHPQMEFYTMQLRSADEGQTVFYECHQCGWVLGWECCLACHCRTAPQSSGPRCTPLN